MSTFAHLLTLPRYAETRITLLDSHLPSLESPTNFATLNPNAASIDSSRIVRPDYAKPSYARLAIAAQEKWRKGYGECLSCGQHETIYAGIKGTEEILKCEDETCTHGPVYRESGLIITGDAGGTEYVEKARKNAEALGLDIRGLNGSDEIAAALEGRSLSSRSDKGKQSGVRSDETSSGKKEHTDHGLFSRPEQGREKDGPSAMGETGYINYSSGWVDNGRAMANLMTHCITLTNHRNRQPSKG